MPRKKATPTKTVLSEVYGLLQDNTVNKSDILEYIRKEQEQTPALIDEMGEVTEKMVADTVRQEATPLVADLEVIGDNIYITAPSTTTKELKKQIVEMPSKDAARLLIDNYYKVQKMRIALHNQMNMSIQKKDDGPVTNATVWLYENICKIESDIGGLLKAFTSSCYLGRWATAVHGVGPVIAAGLIAHLEIQDTDNTITPNAGQWLSYCGLNDKNRPWLGAEKSKTLVKEVISEYAKGGEITDNVVLVLCERTGWKMHHFENRAKNEKGEWTETGLVKACSILPYNQKLKTICYHFGESIIKQQNSEKSLYGKLYKQRLAYENNNNDQLLYADQAAAGAARVGKNTNAYKYYSEGKLPPQHIIRRAMRWTEKMFISHLFEAAWYNKYGTYAPDPYIMAVCGHKDYIGPEIPYDSFDRDPECIAEHRQTDIKGVAARRKDAFRVLEEEAPKTPKKRGRKSANSK